MERKCQAEIHHVNCPCLKCVKTNCNDCGKTNVDHFTPRGLIVRVWKKKNAFANRRENLQYLSLECHRLKDRSTAQRIALAFRQKKGQMVTLDDYREFRNEHDLIIK